MRRLIARAAAAAALVALILAQSLTASGQSGCTPLTEENLREGVEAAAVIVVGTIAEGPGDDSLLVVPERYFKGTAEARSFILRGVTTGPCPKAGIDPGTRLLLILENTGNQLAWPDASRVFVLADGRARNAADSDWDRSETELEARLHDLTGQDSVPVELGEEGEQIDWIGTVLPVTGALLIVFSIGLVLMRVWHRIDPT